MTDIKAQEEETTESDELTERLFEAAIGTLELFSVYLGMELGLYAHIDDGGPTTEGELADRAGIHVRYSREWLEQQAVAGLLTVDDSSAPPEDRRYRLPPANRGALVDQLDGGHVAPFAPMVIGIAGVLDQVVEAYRTGGGVRYEHYGHDFRHGQGGINRPAFSDDLISSWLPAVDGVAARLTAGGRLLDVGCGHGWSTIAMQQRWPEAEVIGIDADKASVADARDHAAEAGVDVRFSATSAEEAAALGPFDVAVILEALHDMSAPLDVLQSIRKAMTADGIVVIADEAVADSFVAPGDELERMMYGWSVSHCLPAAMADQPSAAIGTAIRPATVAELAESAGFTACEVVDVDGGFFRIYRLT